jgi:adenylate cyclase
MQNEEISFGRFRLDLGRRELRRDEVLVPLHRRALEILCVLAAARGAVVGKDELLAQLWRGRVVEEGNLYVHVSALRKALDEHGEGHGYIVTVPGRGYRLTGLPRASATEFVMASPRQPLSLPDRPSIAILPFLEEGVAPDDSYFGDGVIEEIVGSLSALPEIFVISRNSTLRYRQLPADLESVRRELGVRYVLSGRIMRSSNRIRVSTELADTETRGVVWHSRVDGAAGDLFAIQDELSERIAQTLAPQIVESELRRIRLKRTENLNAYDCFLRGLDLIYRMTRPDFEQARRMLERSIALDPGYSAPYAFAAVWHSVNVQQGWSVDTKQDLIAAEELSAAALAHNPLDIYALSIGGHLRSLLFRDYDTALALFERALRASPNSAVAWARSATTFSYIGDGAEGRRRAEHALRLSPFDRHNFYTHLSAGIGAYTEGEYEDAIPLIRRSYAENQLYNPTLRFLAASLAGAGRLAEAREMGQALLRLEPAFRVHEFCRGYAYRDPRHRDRLAQHLVLAGLPP